MGINGHYRYNIAERTARITTPTDGTIYWESVDFGEDGRLTSVDKYLDAIDSSNLNEKQKDRISSELAVLQRNIDAAINAFGKILSMVAIAGAAVVPRMVLTLHKNAN